MKQNSETPKPRSVAEKPKKGTAQARERNFEPSEPIAAPKFSRRPTRERVFRTLRAHTNPSGAAKICGRPTRKRRKREAGNIGTNRRGRAFPAKCADVPRESAIFGRRSGSGTAAAGWRHDLARRRSAYKFAKALGRRPTFGKSGHRARTPALVRSGLI